MEQHQVIDGIDVFIEGQGPHTVLMVHGWPDTYRVWDAQVSALQEQYRCVRFTLPGFDISKPRRAYSLDETVRALLHIVEQVSPHDKVTLMVHDWGCVFGYQFYMCHPDRVARLVGIDIGDTDSRQYQQSLGVAAKLMVDAIESKAPRIYIGSDAATMGMLTRLSPDFAANLIYKNMKSLLG